MHGIIRIVQTCVPVDIDKQPRTGVKTAEKNDRQMRVYVCLL